VKDIEEEACQQYCDIIYQSRCLFFVYDRKQRTCNLLSEPIDDYANTCKKIAGPKAPSIADCKEVADDPCKVRSCSHRASNCFYFTIQSFTFKS
jgi:hypothetical protein